MSEPSRPSSPASAPPPAALLQAWLEQSHELLALTDAAGRLSWCNPGFERATGLAASTALLDAAPPDWQRGAPRDALNAALQTGLPPATELPLRGAAGQALWVQVRVSRVGADWLWTLVDVSAQHELAGRAQHLSELLDMAQEFGRLGVWEREIPSGRGRWDRHVFAFWGMDATNGDTPDFDVAATRVHPDDRLDGRYLESTRQPGRHTARYRVVHPDGTVRWLHSQWEVKNGPDGRPDRAIGIMLDDTAVYELARSRDDTAAQLKLVTELADVVLWRHDFKTARVHYNDHGFKVLGIPHRVGGLTLEESRSFTHPDDVPRLAASAAHALATGVPIDTEVRHLRSDGQLRYILVRRVIERDALGQPQAFTGVSLDVTDRHLAQAALQTANERAALIARHAGIGTWQSDESGLPALWDEQMFRLRGLEPRPTSMNREERLALVHPDDRAHMLDTYPKRIYDPQSAAYEFRVRWPDGQYRWLASRSAPLLDTRGKVVRRVGVNWDITDHKNAELARQQALLAERESRAKSDFLARMSHELRTPLNAVLGFTQLLQLDAREQPGSDQLDKLSHIRAAGEHLLTLINDALDLSSLEAGTLKLDLQPVALALAVARALPLIEEAAAAKALTIRTGRLEGTVRADPTRLHQVLLNLLGNAVKYNRTGGEIVIDTAPGDIGPMLSVRDTGRGMNADQLAHLFEPFNRLGLETEGIEGSGIGLTIARALVDGMGGRLGVTSAPGQGTEFQVVLPRVCTEADTVAPPGHVAGTAESLAEVAAGLAPTVRPAQVLYVEDNAVNVLLVNELMAQLPRLRIESVATGAAGVERAIELQPDLVLVDMQLPDFDGFEVLRRLRARPETAAITCIALSANAMPEDIARALAAGFDDYWTKPIRFKEFLVAMARRFPVDAS